MTVKKRLGLCVLVLLLFLGLVNSVERYFPPSGPKPGEMGKYVYTVNGASYRHCRYCPEGAFDNTANNERTQEPLCIAKYNVIAKEITAYELETKKIPVCKIGETPSCGPPPQGQKTADYFWYCDPGYSNTTYSVYFSCLLIHKQTNVVTWSYYCNESLKWVKDSNISSNPIAVPNINRDTTVNLDMVLIASGAVIALLVGLLIAVTICICQNRRQRGAHSTSDTEASTKLMVELPGKSDTSDNYTGHASKKSADSSACDSVSTVEMSIDEHNAEEEINNKETTSGRLSPYGAEKQGTICCLGNESFSKSLQSKTSRRCNYSCEYDLQSDITERNSTGDCFSVQHVPLDRVPMNHETFAICHSERCQCPEHFNTHSSESTRNETCLNLLEMKPVHPGDYKSYNNLNGVHKVTDVERVRPDPPGNSMSRFIEQRSRNIPISCSESGYYDDENDKNHNTRLKQIATGSEGNSSEVGNNETNEASPARRTSLCRYPSTSSSFEINIEELTCQGHTNNHETLE